MRILWRWNIAMAALHAVQGCLMLALSNGFSLPLSASFLRLDADRGRLVPVTETLWEIRIGPLVAGFLFLSAVAHLAVTLPPVRVWYERNLTRGLNVARWVEYSLSASLMIVVIALLVGIYDVATLLTLFAANTSMILFGLMMELHNESNERVRWTPFWLGCAIGVVPWIAIGLYLVGPGSPGGPPGFVYAIYASIFVFFNVFALNMAAQYARIGRWSDYVFGEKAYILLSLVAKSALAWQVFAGTLRPV